MDDIMKEFEEEIAKVEETVAKDSESTDIQPPPAKRAATEVSAPPPPPAPAPPSVPPPPQTAGIGPARPPPLINASGPRLTPGMMLMGRAMPNPSMLQAFMGMGAMGMPHTLPSAQSSNEPLEKAGTKRKGRLRTAAGEVWVDKTLDEWPENDFRLFIGQLSPEVTDHMLSQAFTKYPSFAKARVVPHPREPGRNKGYGFVSLLNPMDMLKALDEMQGKYIGLMPIRIRRAKTEERDLAATGAKKSLQKKLIGLRKTIDKGDPAANLRKQIG